MFLQHLLHDADIFDGQSGYQFAMNFDMDNDAPRIYATDDVYTESPMSFMTPPNLSDLSVLRDRGGKIILFHGLADSVFSSDDSVRWYNELNAENVDMADEFAKLFLVPGMGHCGGGPSTDQFDLLTPLVAWVEKGEAPERIIASARGPGNPRRVNPELPPEWAPNRTRPLCPYPQIGRYDGEGDIEDAASFICEAP